MGGYQQNPNDTKNGIYESTQKKLLKNSKAVTFISIHIRNLALTFYGSAKLLFFGVSFEKNSKPEVLAIVVSVRNKPTVDFFFTWEVACAASSLCAEVVQHTPPWCLFQAWKWHNFQDVVKRHAWYLDSVSRLFKFSVKVEEEGPHNHLQVKTKIHFSSCLSPFQFFPKVVPFLRFGHI